MRTWNPKKWLALAAAVGGLAGVAPAARADVAQQAAQQPPGQRYSVTWTEGTNLIVTDNRTNTLFYYTVDKDQPAGSPLKLRGSLDLSQIGQQTITPKTFNLQPKPGS